MALRGWCWVVGLLVAFAACGKVSDDQPTAAGGAGAGAGRPPLVEAGTHSGGSAGEEAGEGGDPGVPYDPATLDWSWQKCGSVNPQERVRWARFALDDHAVLLGYESGAVRLAGSDGSGPAPILQGAEAGLSSAVSPGGLRYAQLSLDRPGLGEVFRLDTVQQSTLEESTSEPCGDRLKFSLDGKRVLVWGDAGHCVFDADTGQRLLRVVEPAPFAALVGDELRLQAGELGQERLVRYDLHGMKVADDAIALGGGLDVAQLAPATDTAIVLFPGGDEGALALVDQTTGTRSSPLVPLTQGAVAYSADGAIAVLGTTVLRTSDGEVLHDLEPIPRPFGQIEISASGERALLLAAFHGPASAARLIDVANGIGKSVLGQPSPSALGPLGLAVSPDGKWFARIDRDGLTAWKPSSSFGSSVPIWNWPGQGSPFWEASYSPLANGGEALLAVPADGQKLFTPNGRGVLVGPPEPNSPPFGCDGRFVSFSPSGTRLAGANGGYSVDVCDTAGQQLARLPSVSCNSSAAFSADERWLATSGPELYRTSDWSRVWPTAEPKPIPYDFENPRPLALSRVLFLPGGKELLVSSCTGEYESPSCTSEVYSVATGARLRSLPLTASRPSLSPDGAWLVAGSQLYHLATGTERSLSPPDAVVSVFEPSGDMISALANGGLSRYCRVPQAE